MRVLVTGGVRSGKSTHAESLLAARDDVRYVAAGPRRDDADWAARVAAHRARRPPEWETVESHDLAAALDTERAVLVDCLGTWLTAVIDDADGWEWEMGALEGLVERHLAAALPRLTARDDVVLVTNEVGWGVVAEHRSGRVFADLLGRVNRRVAEVCDEVHLVVAGRTLML